MYDQTGSTDAHQDFGFRPNAGPGFNAQNVDPNFFNQFKTSSSGFNPNVMGGFGNLFRDIFGN
jgi:hypothetical protein